MKSEKWLLLAAMALLLCSCASSQSTKSAKPFAIPADIAGIVHSGRTNSPEEYALLDRMGSTWTLITFYWAHIEPTEGQWDFDYYDEFVNTAKEAGKKVMGTLAYDAGWIHADGKRRDYIPPDKLDLYLNYVRQTVAHFQGRVDAWCIWNEPNFLSWTGSMEEFLVLSRKAADAVREVDSEVILLGGAFNRGVFGLPKAYIRGLFESGAMEKTDGVAFHPYDLNPARTAKLYDNFRALVSKYGFADRIWITEVGYPTGGWYPTKAPEKKFPEYVVKTFVNLAVAGAPKIFWYQLFDPSDRIKSDSGDFFGLVRSEGDYTSKGAEAFRLCATYLAGTIYHPYAPRLEGYPGIPRSVKVFYFEKPTGGGTLVLWKEGAPVNIDLGYFYVDLMDNFIVHDPVSGGTFRIWGSTITVGSMPVFVTWEGNDPTPEN